jgi:hypothetical protein
MDELKLANTFDRRWPQLGGVAYRIRAQGVNYAYRTGISTPPR